MDRIIQIRRGEKANLNNVDSVNGELRWTTDTKELYIGQDGAQIKIAQSAAVTDSDITIGAGFTLDVSAGTLVLADDQLETSWIGAGALPSDVTVNNANWSGTDLSVANGGTGASTLTDHGLLVGSGTDAITPMSVGTTGQLVKGATGADPAWSTTVLTETTNTFNIANGTASLDIAAGKALDINDNLTVTAGQAITLAAEDAAGSITLDNTTLEVENTNATQRAVKIVVGTDAAATLTVEGANGVINQDLTSDASPTFTAVNATIFDTNIAAAGVTLTGTTLAADGTDSNIDINITPKGTGEVNLPKVDIDGGAIDGTAIGANSAAAATVTTLTTTGNIELGNASDTTISRVSAGVVAIESKNICIDGTAKTTMVDADRFGIIDSEASNAPKTLSWAYVKSILKTYFDSLYTLSNLGGIAHSLATAANDFIIASGAGVFVKKTLAETKEILGLGTIASQAASSVAITGGTINGASVGVTTPAAGAFTIVTLPETTSATSGPLKVGTEPFLHNYKDATATGKNVFIGKGSGNFTLGPSGGAADLGSYNVCIGDDTGAAFTTAQNNVAIGWTSLNDCTEGNRNVAIGYMAMCVLTTAKFNNAIGDAAGGRITIGDGNNLLGYVAGYKLTEGQHNIHIGSYAGYGTNGDNGPQTDNFGILIGYSANRSVASDTQLVNYIGIGKETKIDKSNQIKLGNKDIAETNLYGNVLLGAHADMATQRGFFTYNSYTDGDNYERGGISWSNGNLLIGTWQAGTGVNQNVYFHRNGTVLLNFDSGKVNVKNDLVFGTDNVYDIGASPTTLRPRTVYAGTNVIAGAQKITSGAGTGITVDLTGAVARTLYKVTVTFAAYADADTTKGVVIATLPERTKLVGFYADTTAAYTGGTVSAATLEVGITAEGAAEILAPHDVLTGVVTKGLADADMGTSMTRAAQIQGGYLPSWTGTTAVYATIDTTGGNTNALATGSTTFYFITERY